MSNRSQVIVVKRVLIDYLVRLFGKLDIKQNKILCGFKSSGINWKTHDPKLTLH